MPGECVLQASVPVFPCHVQPLYIGVPRRVTYPFCRVWDASTGALLRTIKLDAVVYSVSWGRDWVLDTQKATAFAMGHHPRLGAGSRLQVLDTEMVRMILDYA